MKIYPETFLYLSSKSIDIKFCLLGVVSLNLLIVYSSFQLNHARQLTARAELERSE